MDRCFSCGAPNTPLDSHADASRRSVSTYHIIPRVKPLGLIFYQCIA